MLFRSHNLGTLHTHDLGIDACASGSVQRGTIMSYCHGVSGASANIDLRFHRGTAQSIESFIATAPCLASDCNGNGLEDAAEISASPALDTNGAPLFTNVISDSTLSPLQFTWAQATNISPSLINVQADLSAYFATNHP